MRIRTAILSTLFFVLLQSCQKELSLETGVPDNNRPVLPGNWKFAGLDVMVVTGFKGDVGGVPGRIDASYTAISQNNTGRFVITSGEMKAPDLSYKLSGKVKIFYYLGGIPVDPPPPDELLDFVLPPDSVSVDYRQVGNDSLFFPHGFPFDIPDTNGEPHPLGLDSTGARFSINGDTLTIKTEINKTTIYGQGNDEVELTQKLNRTATLIRQ